MKADVITFSNLLTLRRRSQSTRLLGQTYQLTLMSTSLDEERETETAVDCVSKGGRKTCERERQLNIYYHPITSPSF